MVRLTPAQLSELKKGDPVWVEYVTDEEEAPNVFESSVAQRRSSYVQVYNRSNFLMTFGLRSGETKDGEARLIEKPVPTESKAPVVADSAGTLAIKADQAHRRVYVEWLYDRYFPYGSENNDLVNALDKMLTDLQVEIPGDVLAILRAQEFPEEVEDEEDSVLEEEEQEDGI